MYVALFMNWEWMWGILFFIWVIPDIYTEVTYFIEPITKKEHPVVYWMVIVTWILLGLYALSTLFIDYYSY
jgi:hypothetical protein